MKWEVLAKNKIKKESEIINTLLKNRKINSPKEKKDYFDPKDPTKISLKSLGINEKEVATAIKRIKKAIKSKEKVFVYGDYDADGICATAIMWEALFSLGVNALPYIPERFTEGYGLNVESIKKLKSENPDLGLIVTVDHGIVAEKKVDIAKDLGIDVIITDHHEKGKVKPKPYALIHTTKISGSGVSWILARELGKRSGLELAAIGTIADSLPLIGPNRQIVKFGLKDLRKTKRPGLASIFQSCRITKENIGTYEVGFIIAPRLNAMGRLGKAIESLRLLCTKDKRKANTLSELLNKTNSERQKIVETVSIHARSLVKNEKIIVLSSTEYHEGVIGLAAGRLADQFYRPTIVLSENGDISKASARSIEGFNIIEAIRSLDKLIIEGGGHKMAAGFSIKTKLIDKFRKEINKLGKELLTEEILSKKIKIDLELDFNLINWSLVKKLEEFKPTGYGNPNPVFTTKEVEIIDARLLGQDKKHLKMKLRQKEQVFDSIYFGGGEIYPSITPDTKIDIAYQIEINEWNNRKDIQLKIKDTKLG